MDGWMDGRMDGWMEERRDGLTGGWMGRIDDWVDGYMTEYILWMEQ